MKKILYILIIIMYSPSIYSQEDSCDDLIIRNNYISIDTQDVKNTFDYIRKKYPKYEKYISDRKSLERIPLLVNNLKESIFLYDNLMIKLEYSNKHFNPKPFFYPIPVDEDTIPNRMLYINEQTPYGITHTDTIISVINSMLINGIKVDPVSYDRLFNPNILATYISIKPIEAFLSEDKNNIYIYIFGEPKSDMILRDTAFYFTYMAKMIYTMNGDYVGKIIMRGEELEYFNFHQCPNFVGF